MQARYSNVGMIFKDLEKKKKKENIQPARQITKDSHNKRKRKQADEMGLYS